jgi:hypothetical protein
MNNLARKLGLTKGAYISQLLTDPPLRSLSEKTARKWEKRLGLSDGWLDGRQEASRAFDALLLEHVLAVVFDSLKAAKLELRPAQLSELVVMQYTDAVALGRLDEERVRKLVKLLKR